VTLSAVCVFELKYIAANIVDQHVWNSSWGFLELCA